MKKAKKTVKDVGWGPMIATHGEPPAKRNRSSATSAQRWRSACCGHWLPTTGLRRTPPVL
jgi:hypothetical protein